MKTPLPEKPELTESDRLNYNYLWSFCCQIHDYLAELTEVVEGKQTYAQGYQQALADVRAGVPGLKPQDDCDCVYMEGCGCAVADHNSVVTAVLEHLDLLGKE